MSALLGQKVLDVKVNVKNIHGYICNYFTLSASSSCQLLV